MLKSNTEPFFVQVEFEWDAKKEKLNLIKHGVGFLEGARGSLDRETTGRQDQVPSRRSVVRVVFGAKARNFMRKRTAKYSDDKGEIIGELHRVRDELPSIDELTGKSGRQTKVTLALDNDALSFFKREARRRNTSYQRMIRNLVRAYSQAHTARRLAPSAR